MNKERPAFLRRFVGDKGFYKMILGVTVPIMIQNGISSFVNMLDNVMVGRIGTEQMSGVSIVNQLIFIYFLCIFGGMGGIGIFTAQYYGNNDQEGVRATFRAKLWLGVILTAIAFIVLRVFGSNLIGLFLNEGSETGDLAATLRYAEGYMQIIFISFPAFLVLQVYGSTIRACGETVLPMKAGIAAVLTNLVFNYLLIYGVNIGGTQLIPSLGVNGAAIATVISRYVEMAIIVIWAHTHKKKAPYIVGVYRTLRVRGSQLKSFAIKGTPLLINEALWSIGTSFLVQCYSTRGLDVIAAFNISNTISNMFSIVFFSMGDAVAIVVGQLLGANKIEEAKDTDRKIIAFAVFFSLITAILMASVSWLFPHIYNTNDSVRQLATILIICYAAFSPMMAFCHCTYFTLRSGGKTIITFLFDSAFTWVVSVPIAFVLSRFTNLPVVAIYCFVTGADIIKCIIGFVLVKKGVWAKNITEDI